MYLFFYFIDQNPVYTVMKTWNMPRKMEASVFSFCAKNIIRQLVFQNLVRQFPFCPFDMEDPRLTADNTAIPSYV